MFAERASWLTAILIAGLAAQVGAVDVPLERTMPASFAGWVPRGFVANEGQWDPRAAYAARTSFGTTWVTKDGELRHVLLSERSCATEAAAEPWRPAGREGCLPRTWVLFERFRGGQPARIRPLDPFEGKVSFWKGREPGSWGSGLSRYQALDLGRVYPGVRIQLSTVRGSVEKVFEVEPGADVRRISVEVEGGERMRLNDRDELVWEFPWGEVTLSRPVAWQLVGGEPVSVSVGYRVDVAGRSYGFELGAYDARRSVWIDPIVQATYLGGFNPDHIRAVGVHPLTGEVYVAGYTQSTDFPQTSGGGQSVPGGGFYDAFIARFNHSLTSLLQSTYVGGLGHDLIHDLAFRPSTGEVWVVGGTDSWDLPGTSGGAQSNLGGSYDAFVMRLNAPLTSILQASYFGGSGYDYGYGLAVHPSTGDVYLSGWTTGDLPNTAGGAQATYGGGG